MTIIDNLGVITSTQWQKDNFSRIDFRTSEFDKMIYQKGCKVIWEKSILCSCLDKITGQPDYNCSFCKGKGYDYFDPKQIRLVATSITGNKEQIPIGLLDVGTAYITTMTSDEVNFRDRLTFVDFRTTYSEVLTYDDSVVTGVKLRYDVEEILSVQKLGTVIPTSAYELSTDKKRLIFDSSTFSNDERFSVLYKIKPAYVVIDIIHELRGTPVKFGLPNEEFIILPKQFMIKREDLLPLQRGQLV